MLCRYLYIPAIPFIPNSIGTLYAVGVRVVVLFAGVDDAVVSTDPIVVDGQKSTATKHNTVL